MSKKTIMYPLDAKTGELMPYTWRDYPDDEKGRIKWVENRVFEDDLEYDGYHRGRSAAGFDFKSIKDGKRYPMFLKDFDDAMRNCRVFKNRLIGKFTFCKRGCNYGVKLLHPET